MQAVIFAAGEGVRMRPLTLTTPKPLLLVRGKPILNHIVAALPQEVDELILVVGYKQEQLRAHCGRTFCGRPVTYVEQPAIRGTADALLRCKDVLRGTFMVLVGDDLHGREALAQAASHDLALITAHSDHPERFGVVVRKPDGTIQEIVEKPAVPKSNEVSTGAMVLDTRIFNYTALPTKNGEYCLPDVLAQLARDYPVALVEQTFWVPIGYLADLERAGALLV